jgi:molybdenum cofactor synthesis domain-containing protein
MLTRMSTAGLVVIGDEILSGKTTDTNTPFLIRELRGLGVSLREIAVVPDEMEGIAATVRRFAQAYDHVFTSGGVGPTHDDLTVAAVAQAFGAGLVRSELLERMMRDYHAQRGLPLVERNLRMADVPAGASLIEGEGLLWPVLAMRNVYVLPGIPEIFERKFLAIRERFRSTPFHLRQVFVREEEGAIAHHLDRVAHDHPRVALGSYPRWTPASDGHRVKLTLEGKSAEDVERACAALVGLLGAACVVREA